MWLMSQNRDVLVNVNDICFYEVNKDSEIIYQFRCYGYGDDYYILGEYSTEEKAMKVMGMIQEQIVFCSERYEIVRPVLKSDPFEPYWKKREVVFRMPKDSEVE